jgi:hypothetical protein
MTTYLAPSEKVPDENQSVKKFETSAASSVKNMASAFTSLVQALQNQDAHIARLESREKSVFEIAAIQTERNTKDIDAMKAELKLKGDAMEALISKIVTDQINAKVAVLVPRIEALESQLKQQSMQINENCAQPIDVLELRLSVMENAVLAAEERAKNYARIKRLVELQRLYRLQNSRLKPDSAPGRSADFKGKEELKVSDGRDLLAWITLGADRSSFKTSPEYSPPDWAFTESQLGFYKWLKQGMEKNQVSEVPFDLDNTGEVGYSPKAHIKALEGALQVGKVYSYACICRCVRCLQACLQRVHASETQLARSQFNTRMIYM